MESLSQLTILLVTDDDSHALRLEQGVVASHADPVRVHRAHDLAAARAQREKSVFDLAILDLGLFERGPAAVQPMEPLRPFSRRMSRDPMDRRHNGIGIDPEQGSRIFAPRQRLHTDSRYPGSGIDLAICAQIIAAHGGRIWVESSVGAGSTFYASLPRELGDERTNARSARVTRNEPRVRGTSR